MNEQEHQALHHDANGEVREKTIKEELQGTKVVQWLQEHSRKLALGGGVLLGNLFLGGVPFNIIQSGMDGVESFTKAVIDPLGDLVGDVVRGVGAGIVDGSDGEWGNENG